MLSIDELIIGFDRGLRTLAGAPRAARATPGASLAEPELSADERQEAAALMRVNHCGEICAQALYQGQALASENDPLKRALEQAAREEEDHLAWTEQRIAELGGRTSLLNPLWYAGSLAIGFAAGKAGDAWNLGFLKETERQVEAHLQGHLDRLSPRDAKTRAVVEVMQRDEAQHARIAESLGARELPGPVKALMKASAKVMTTISYRL
jgi:ubiquinone biosynthesis monooxygenase Coq7